MARGRKPGAVQTAGPRLPAADQARAELAADFRRGAVVPDQELVRLTAVRYHNLLQAFASSPHYIRLIDRSVRLTRCTP
jgi:hypothetical protein